MVLIVALQDLFKNDRINLIYSWSCITKAHTKIDSFIWDAMIQKTVFSWEWWSKASVDNYLLNIDKAQDWIFFLYSWTKVKNFFPLYLQSVNPTLRDKCRSYEYGWCSHLVEDTFQDKTNNCWGTQYYTNIKELEINGTDVQSLWLKLNPWLSSSMDINKWGAFVISNDINFSNDDWDNISWSVIFQYCTKDPSVPCKDMQKVIFDKRSQNIAVQECLALDANLQCQKWTQ